MLRSLITLSLVGLMHSAAGARTCEPLFLPRRDLSSQTIERIERYGKIDSNLGVPRIHQTEISLVRDSQLRPVKTPISAVLIHGLYNSPAAFAALAGHLHSLGMNVINLRLDGHYETDTTPMQHTVRWQRWLKDARRAVQLARELGDTVLLAGHSTGALMATWLAVQDPTAIRGLALFAPAFRVQLSQQLGARALDLLDIDLRPQTGRLITGHAGGEVTEMANSFARFASEAPQRLATVPVWMANTPADATIDVAKADDFFASLTRFEPGEAARLSVIVPVSHRVLHNALAGERNSQFPRLIESMDAFFGFVKLAE